MRITRVYTRTGDGGNTHLVAGREVRKDDVRIEAYGTVDELNATLGIVRTFLADTPEEVATTLDPMLDDVQNDLFNLGADLATLPADRWEGMYRVSEADTTRLEGWIDRLNDELPPLKEFVLPGGGRTGAFLHLARTVCRRAERVVVTLGDSGAADLGSDLIYLNRLSDFLFVAGRWVARRLGEPEPAWKNPSKRGHTA